MFGHISMQKRFLSGTVVMECGGDLLEPGSSSHVPGMSLVFKWLNQDDMQLKASPWYYFLDLAVGSLVIATGVAN